MLFINNEEVAKVLTMEDTLSAIEVLPCASAEEAARGTDILASCTNAQEPTVQTGMLEPGIHLTRVAESEFMPDVYPKLDLCIGGAPLCQVVRGAAINDSQGFPTYLAGNVEALNRAMGRGLKGKPKGKDFHGRLVSLADLITGNAQGRSSTDEISASSGIRVGGEDSVKGLQFVTVGSLIYDLAKKAGLGREAPTEWFLQDIRD